MPIFCQKTSILQETRCSNDHILSKKRPFCKKIRCSHAIIFIFFKTPCYHAHISSKKRQNCQNYKILWAKKVSSMSFFPISRKNDFFHAHILSKKHLFSKKHKCSHPHTLSKKTSIFSKTQCSHVIFIKFFMKNPQCHAHIWPKNVNSVKTPLYF